MMNDTFDIRETVNRILEEKTEEEKLYLYSDHCQLFDEYPSLLKRKRMMLQDAYAYLYENDGSALYHASEEETIKAIGSDIDNKEWKILDGALLSERYRMLIHDKTYAVLSRDREETNEE